jgi:hypothetical protein
VIVTGWPCGAGRRGARDPLWALAGRPGLVLAVALGAAVLIRRGPARPADNRGTGQTGQGEEGADDPPSRPSPLDAQRDQQADYYDAEQAISAVEQFEKETGLIPAAVVPIIEMCVHVSVAISNRYGLLTLSDECLARAGGDR